jgi:hypothetical protein
MKKEMKPFTQFIIKESYSGTQTLAELFADILFYRLKSNWTPKNQSAIMKPLTVEDGYNHLQS